MVNIQEYKKNLERKTCNTKELAEMLGVSEAKARRVTHIEDFPKIKIGRDIRIILSQLDQFLESHLGQIL